jgi:hypothetical protein
MVGSSTISIPIGVNTIGSRITCTFVIVGLEVLFEPVPALKGGVVGLVTNLALRLGSALPSSVVPGGIKGTPTSVSSASSTILVSTTMSTIEATSASMPYWLMIDTAGHLIVDPGASATSSRRR